ADQSRPRFQSVADFGAFKRLSRQARIKCAVLAFHDHHAIAPTMETKHPLRTESAGASGVGIVNEGSPTIVEDPMGCQKKTKRDGAVVGVTILHYLAPTDDAVIRAQILLAAVSLDQAM